jgi:hypothetical protein
MPFADNPRQYMLKGIPFLLKDYCELVGITGRIIISVKAGHIDHQQQPILQRLGLSNEQWLTLTTKFESTFVMRRGQSK